ncbi:Type IV secretion system protein virB9 [Paraburkholderia aspalathi]|uniref:TrbG/VirB9 family P-type conjugative transfer protein n=1 Tax=Paraburkholderia aspalathi TaxID=1324617 RepID=UPI001AFF61D5|nr:TrbG/VirB9 family P-type conjugative transfer protein [Paraburkholderia aspalathi]CAE6850462.1 Type IV secretion system protein virB9 [Paraburkholderia aspalathi]
MNLKPLAFCVAVAVVFPLPALAVQPTQASPGDSRVRFVDYDAHNVVTIYGRVGADTLVMFEKGEKVRDLSGGDTDAWGVGVTTAGNGFFIKPKVTSPNTNVHVITDKRVYSIDMKLAGKGQTNYLTVWYLYPEEEAAQRAAAASRNTARDLLNYGGAATAKNRNYTVQGSDEISPSEAWDDGTAFYFRVSAHRSVPAVYWVDEAGKEHQANFNTEPDGTLTIHKIASKFVFRSGDLVACVFNEAYDPVGKRSTTNTASPNVERVLKKGEQQ